MDANEIAGAVAELAEKLARERMGALVRDLTEVLKRYGGSAPIKAAKQATTHPHKKQRKPPPKDTDAGRVLHAVDVARGMFPADIKKAAERAKGATIPPKTFNQALRRLTKYGFVRKDDHGRLYPGKPEPQKHDSAA
jgi:hypothetical protein